MSKQRRPAYESDPQVLYLSQLLEEIHHGLLRVPRFQRPFVWDDEQRLELFRSVAEGTPIGSIMVWRSNLEIPSFERLGPHSIPLEATGSSVYSYLLDGHQRLSTLYSALYPPDPQLEWHEDQDALQGWQVFYDLEKLDFVLENEPGAVLLPLHLFLDTQKLMKVLRELKSDEHIAAADALARALREYKIPVIPLASDDLEAVTRTFQRVNSQGTPMSDVHMVAALCYSPEFQLADLIAQGQERLRASGWDADEKTFLQVFKVLAGADLYETGVDEVANKVRLQGASILELAVQHLGWAGQALRTWGVHSPLCVPYTHQPILLAAAYFHSNASIGQAVFDQLCRWFWLTSFYGAAHQSRIQAEHRRIRDIVCGVKVGYDDLRATPLPFAYDFRPARHRAMLLILARAVKDGPQVLALHGAKAVGRFVTEVERKKLIGPDRSLVSGPENVFIAAPETFAEVRRMSREPETPSDWLDTQSISQTAHHALVVGDLPAFLRERATCIQDMERNFLAALEGPDYRFRSQ